MSHSPHQAVANSSLSGKDFEGLHSMAGDGHVISSSTKKFPPLSDQEHFSQFFGFSMNQIELMCDDENKLRNYYDKLILRKKNGSIRIIHAPKKDLKFAQRCILENILNHIEVAGNVFGFVRGRNIVQNANFHFGAKHILNVDIKDFFPSIKIAQVKKIFLELGYGEKASMILAQICCLEGRVPQGAPTSPALGNVVLGSLDEKLTRLSHSEGLKYSRYADDLTFSSSDWIDNVILYKVRQDVEDAGFELNYSKTRFLGPGDQLEVTGVVINEKIQPPRKWRKFVRAKLNRINNQGKVTRRQMSYLVGIVGVAYQYKDSSQMKRLLDEARRIIYSKQHTTIGWAYDRQVPSILTDIEAEALNQLSPNSTRSSMSRILEISEQDVDTCLQSAYIKIGVSNWIEAVEWANKNL